MLSTGCAHGFSGASSRLSHIRHHSRTHFSHGWRWEGRAKFPREQWKKPGLFRSYRGLYYPLLQGLHGFTISHYRNPCETASIMGSSKAFFRRLRFSALRSVAFQIQHEKMPSETLKLSSSKNPVTSGDMMLLFVESIGKTSENHQTSSGRNRTGRTSWRQCRPCWYPVGRCVDMTSWMYPDPNVPLWEIPM